MRHFFHRDICIVDIECTGLDPQIHEIIQLSAVILDKTSLEEKATFDMYVRPENFENNEPEAMKVNGLTKQFLDDRGLELSVVLKKFSDFASQPVIMAYWSGDYVDGPFLWEAYKKTKLTNPFDYHTFNIWPLAYLYMQAHHLADNPNNQMGFLTEDVLRAFKIDALKSHNALNDCRNEALILRAILDKLSV